MQEEKSLLYEEAVTLLSLRRISATDRTMVYILKSLGVLTPLLLTYFLKLDFTRFRIARFALVFNKI